MARPESNRDMHPFDFRDRVETLLGDPLVALPLRQSTLESQAARLRRIAETVPRVAWLALSLATQGEALARRIGRQIDRLEQGRDVQVDELVAEADRLLNEINTRIPGAG